MTFNRFDNPPSLLIDAQGRQHVIRSPEKAEKAAVRDYPVAGGKWADPIDIVAARDGKGAIINWQAVQLPGGWMAVTTALSESGGNLVEGASLFASFSNGSGKWSAPLCVSGDAGRQDFSHKDTGGGNAIASLSTYAPRFASIAMMKDGHACVLMVNNEKTLIGITNAGVTAGGRAVSSTSGESVSSPKVFFLRL